MALADSAGVVLGRCAYTPFGVSESNAGGTPWRFTGRRLDAETGLYHLRARDYAPLIGRFVQPDPIGMAGGINLYAYVGNDPLNATDPRGLFFPFFVGAVAALAGAGTGAFGSAATQLAQRGSINLGDVVASAFTGSVSGIALVTPFGARVAGAIVIGAVGNTVNYLLITESFERTAEGLAMAAALGGIGGRIAGPTPNPFMFAQLSPASGSLRAAAAAVAPRVLAESAAGAVACSVNIPALLAPREAAAATFSDNIDIGVRGRK